MKSYYFYRGQLIETFGKGYCWTEQMCKGDTSGIPIYKTIEDARNAIRKYLDGTHKKEPRIIQTAGWNGSDWFVEKEVI